MRMSTLAHASINQLALVDLQIQQCTVPKYHEYAMATMPVDRFVYITKGNAWFFCEEKQLQAGNQDMIYLPGGSAYHSQWLEDSEFMVFDFLLHDAQGQLIRFDDLPSVLFHDTYGSYRGLLEALVAKADTCGPFDWLERMSLSFKLLCELARDTNRAEIDEKRRKIKAGLIFLENNFTKEFYIDKLAQMCCLSTGSFRRLFLECMGISPVEYRNRLRIQKAATLLKSGQFTVCEVAEMVGIRDMAYFCKLFKRYIGATPRVIKSN